MCSRIGGRWASPTVGLLVKLLFTAFSVDPTCPDGGRRTMLTRCLLSRYGRTMWWQRLTSMRLRISRSSVCPNPESEQSALFLRLSVQFSAPCGLLAPLGPLRGPRIDTRSDSPWRCRSLGHNDPSHRPVRCDLPTASCRGRAWRLLGHRPVAMLRSPLPAVPLLGLVDPRPSVRRYPSAPCSCPPSGTRPYTSRVLGFALARLRPKRVVALWFCRPLSPLVPPFRSLSVCG